MLTSVPGGSGSSSSVSEFMVPVTLSTARPDGNVYHKVQYGQSLWSIAIAYGTTIKNIQALNNLGELSTVYQGQELLVLTGATPAAVTSTVAPTSEVTATVTSPTMVASTSTSTPIPQETSTSAADVQSNSESERPTSSRVLVVVLIVAAFVGAGMAVWLIRDPGN